MDYQVKINGERGFKCPDSACCIGNSASGYTLYHAVSMTRPADSDYQPWKDSEGNNIVVAANHPLTVMCAKGTWFKLSGNTGDVVITY